MMIINKSRRIYLFFFSGLIFISCNHRNKVDVSNIPVNVKIARFDKEFDAMRTKPMAEQAAYLEKKYGIFYRDFIALILQNPGINIKDTSYFKQLRQVFANPDYPALKHDVDAVYPDLKEQEAALTDAFRRIKYYFPDKKLPVLYAYFSGFEAQTVVGDNYIGIGLDLFLGADSRFYPSLTNQYPHYLSRFFNPQNICPRVVEGIAREDMFPESDTAKTLLSKMVYNGKIMYLMDQLLPDVADTAKICYTGAQLKWCTQFEPKIWGYFLDENLLYETDYPKIQKYLTEAPFTPGLGEKNESAPKLAVWTGWQIVKQYMDKHPEVTLKALLLNNDAQKILNESNYHPK